MESDNSVSESVDEKILLEKNQITKRKRRSKDGDVNSGKNKRRTLLNVTDWKEKGHKVVKETKKILPEDESESESNNEASEREEEEDYVSVFELITK